MRRITSVGQSVWLKSVAHPSSGSNAEGFALEALEEFVELCFAGLRQHQAALGGFAVVNFVKFAEFADAIEMTEEVHDIEFIYSKGWKQRGPNDRCVFSADRLAALGS